MKNKGKKKPVSSDSSNYTDWTYTTGWNKYLVAKKYTGTDTDVTIPMFYNIDRNTFEGMNITSITLEYADKLHHLWDEPMPGCENVHRLQLNYSGEDAAFLHLRGWVTRLPGLSEIEVRCPVPHQLIIWEGVPELSSDLIVRDENCQRLNVYGHHIDDVTLPTSHLFLGMNPPLTTVQDAAMRAALLFTAISKPEILGENKAEIYLTSLTRNCVRWFPAFMQHQVSDSVMIPLFKAIQPLKAEKYESILAASQEANNLAMAAAVIEERDKHIDREKEEQKRERQNQYDFDHPFSARSMSLEWRWKTWGENEVMLTKCLIHDTDTILIPPEIGGRTVTGLGDYLFCKHREVKEIVLTDSIRSIGEECFAGSAIQTIILPEGLMEIKEGAFMGCKNLSNITLPGSIRIVNQRMFQGSGIETVTISPGITTLHDSAFYRCKQLKKVILPDGLEKIGPSCFEKCGLEEITLPSSVSSICENAFSQTCLRECILPNALDYIAPFCFRESQISRIRIPAGLEGIGAYAFYDCTQLTTVECADIPVSNGMVFLPDNMSSIEEYAFSGCRGIREVHLPAAIRHIYDSLFEHTGLEHVSIPKSVEQINRRAFAHCSRLKTVEFDKDAELTMLYESCFERTGIREICLPGKVKNVKRNAFCNCHNLVRLECSKSTDVSGKAFTGTRLIPVSLPDDAEKRIWEAPDLADRQDG